MSIPILSNATDVTIGIDISKDRLDAHAHPAGTVRQFANDRTGIAALLGWISPQQPTRIIFEATGAYHKGLQTALAKADLPGVKVNPWQARRSAEATGKRAKTDAVDAAMLLARFGATLQPEVRPAPHPVIAGLTGLLAARRALIKDRTAALNRGKTLTLLKRQNQLRPKQIEAQIKGIDSEQTAMAAKQDRLKARLKILLSIPGIGAVSAVAMLIDMPELGSMDAKRTASLGGLAPITRQSGKWQDKSRIQGGRAALRQALYTPALVAIRFNAPLKATYLGLRKAGKPAKVAIVAIMRKLLIVANALLRDNRMWIAERLSA